MKRILLFGAGVTCCVSFAVAASTMTARSVEMDGPAAFRMSFELPARTVRPQEAPARYVSSGLIAVPVGADVTVEILSAEHDDLGLPSPADLRHAQDSEVEFEPIGVVRHLSLGRLRITAASRDPITGRRRALRRAEVRVSFRQKAHGPAGDRIELDAIDRHLASLVLNPASVPDAATLVAPGAAAPDAAIPTPEPSVLPPLKVLVRQDGLYRITRNDLVTAGADPTGIDPRTFVLTCRGLEIPLQVTGESDGVFDAADLIRFYGKAVGGEETWDNVYRLTGGVRAGLRMASRQAQSIPGAPLAASFQDLARRETDFLYFGSIPESAPSPWLWESLATAVAGTPVFTDQALTLPSVATSPPSTGRLEVHVQSRRETPGASPNHHVRTYVNGHLAVDQSWTGLIDVTLAGDVPTAWLTSGGNVVRIENPSDLGLSIQTEYTDWIALTYPRRYEAAADSLEFAGPGAGGARRFVVTGFTGADVILFDLTNPGQPAIVTQPVVAFDGVSYQIVFDDLIASPPGRYLALRPAAARVPYGFVLDQPSSLRAQAQTGADLLIVVADPFEPAIQPLATLRRNQGLRVVVARLTDLFDEFNGGIAETDGIRNFVQWAFESYAPPAPASLLLVGDATFDPRDNKGEGDNYVSTRFFYAPDFGYTPSDNWFAAVTGPDPIPDLATGRLTARSVADVTTQVNRLIAYETTPPVAALNSGLLYVADDDDASFPLLLEDLITTLHPPNLGVRRVYLNDFPQTTSGVNAARDQIRQFLDTGSLATVFAGHGSRTAWTAENLWSTTDVPTLAASDRLTFVASLNCVNGYFANTDVEPYSLAEKWSLSPQRGGVAVWTPSALSTLASYQTLAADLFEQLFDFRELHLGRASWQALLDAYLAHGIDAINLQEMIFFGDPTTRLALDWDRDELLDRDEAAAGTNRDDADSDDDGVPDGAETSWSVDTDGDGRVNALDEDADNDSLPDGLEMGVTTPPASTDVTRGHFIPDADPATTTNPLSADTDGGGAPDGAEDRNANGKVDAGETNPKNALDDPACAPARPAEVQNLMVATSGNDVVLTWNGQTSQDPCVLYRIYVATGGGVATTFASFTYAGTVGTTQWRHAGAAADAQGYTYLVTATSLAHGEGPLGHYGR